MKELADGIFSDSSKKSQPRGSIWKLEGSYQPISYHHVRPGESRIQKASSVLPRSHQGSIRLGPHGKAVFGGYLPGHSRSPPVLQARKSVNTYRYIFCCFYLCVLSLQDLLPEVAACRQDYPISEFGVREDKRGIRDEGPLVAVHHRANDPGLRRARPGGAGEHRWRTSERGRRRQRYIVFLNNCCFNAEVDNYL